jgi:hypothetical protein
MRPRECRRELEEDSQSDHAWSKSLVLAEFEGTDLTCFFPENLLSYYHGVLVHWYICKENYDNCYREACMEHSDEKGRQSEQQVIERVQTGARMEKRMVKVLKGLAEYLDISLGDLLEGIVLHAFAGKAPFSALTLKQIERLKEIYGMDYGVEASHRLREVGSQQEE